MDPGTRKGCACSCNVAQTYVHMQVNSVVRGLRYIHVLYKHTGETPPPIVTADNKLPPFDTAVRTDRL